MRHRRAVVTAVVALAATVLAGCSAGSAGHGTGPADAGPTGIRWSAPDDTSAEFVAPLFVRPPAPAVQVAPGGGSGLLGPDTVQVPDPVPAQRVAPRAWFRPA